MPDGSPHDEQPDTEKSSPGDGRGGPSARTLLIATVLVLVLGYFLSVKLREVGRIQDCVMSGRTNCAPVSGAK